MYTDEFGTNQFGQSNVELEEEVGKVCQKPSHIRQGYKLDLFAFPPWEYFNKLPLVIISKEQYLQSSIKMEQLGPK